MPVTPSILISGYTEEGYGAGPGLARFELLPDGTVGERVGGSAAVLNPSFLADAGEVLLAVEELPSGNVVAVDAASLDLVARASSGGADSCHLTLAGNHVWAANYSSGNASITLLAALLDGTAPKVPELVSHPGSGPVADRQGESHAHQVTDTGRGTVLVSDLGADRVDEYDAVSRTLLGSAQLPPGAGPRHVALSGEFLLVAGELDGRLHVLERSGPAGSWRWLSSVPLAVNEQVIEDAEQFYPSHIQLSDDGSLLYAGIRGLDTVVVLDVSALPESPRFLAQVPSGGHWPRHFALAKTAGDDGRLYVANQLSNNVAVFALDDAGKPGDTPIQTVDFGSPACVLLCV